jgi:21S rRNA (GM2251-2'-O)-methyltransferase
MQRSKILLNKVEYLFGSSVVLSALESQKRQLKKLYIKKEVELNAEGERNAQNIAIQRANKLSLPVEKINSQRMNKLSESRPNQGLLLMASPIELKQVAGLSSFDIDTDSYKITTSNEAIEKLNHPPRPFPFWLVLDQIVDPQNLGAILRTAYFFGVDGVVISTRESSPPTPIVSKASAGALEILDLYETKSIPAFLQKSASEGWTIYGTDLNAHRDKLRFIDPTFKMPTLLQGPTILVVGNEGKGLRKSVSNECDLHLILSRYQHHKTNLSYQVDSLNVSVAAGILIQKVLDF